MTKSDEIRSVAVLGCGFIGVSWAIVFCTHGVEVNMYDVSRESLESVRPRVLSALELLRDEGVVEAQAVNDSIGRVRTFDSLAAAVEGVDYVQECLPEELELKQRVFAEVADITSPHVLIGSSASGLTRLDIVQKVKNHPERCIVAHPTNPPHVLPFMEIAGDGASESAKTRAVKFMESVGQKPVQCKEIYGYVLNRVQLALIQEAFYLVQTGVCSVEAVERAITDGLGLRWAFTGPYGVEELNSINLRDGLRKYKAYMLEGFRNLGTIRDYDDAFIDKAVEGMQLVMKGMNHDEYLGWRDRMVVRTKMLKEAEASGTAGKPAE